MNPGAFVCLAFLAFLACSACAVPVPVSNMRGEFTGYDSIKISWDHEGGATAYKVYRGERLQNVTLLATATEKSFVDSGIEFGKEYLYYVTAVDLSGESNAPLYALTIKQTERPEKPFTIKLVSPEKRTFSFGEKVDFVVEIVSPFFSDLKSLNAVLVNEDFGIEKTMAFDQAKNSFLLSETLPSPESEQGFSTSYVVRVTGVLDNETFSESETYVFTIIPIAIQTDVWLLAINFMLLLGPIILLMALASLFTFMGWKYYLKKRAEKDALNLEFVEVLKERSVWKYDMLKRRVSPEQYAEKERELQGKQSALEARLGHKKKGIQISANPFAGFSREEIEEIGQLVKAMGQQKRQMTMNEMRAWLVGRGKSEKIAKKTAEFIYGEHGQSHSA